MNDLQKFRGIQELLDEIIGPTTVVRESNSEVVWGLWDEAVKQLDEQSSMRIARASNPHCAGYPSDFFVDGSELSTKNSMYGETRPRIEVIKWPKL